MKKQRMVILTVGVLLSAGNVFGIHREKLYKDDVDILYSERVTGLKSAPKPKAILELNAAKSKSPKNKTSLASNTIPIRVLKRSVDSTLKKNDTANAPGGVGLPVPSIIDSEFRFESGNTYHATTDVVIIEGGILKHEPGAVVKWAQNTGLHKDPNRVYIARGLPSEMCINIPDVNEPSDG